MKRDFLCDGRHTIVGAKMARLGLCGNVTDTSVLPAGIESVK